MLGGEAEPWSLMWRILVTALLPNRGDDQACVRREERSIVAGDTQGARLGCAALR